MEISSLVHKTITSCTNRDSLQDVANLMWRHDIGALPVLDADGCVVGMITDRDVCMAAFLQGAPLRSIAVSTAMAKEVVTCKPTDDIRRVIDKMSERQIRRLPVVDDQQRLLGIISLNDIARAASAGKLAPADVVRTLAAISAPRGLASAA
jgi:CBS domain-containing protein